MKTIKELTNTYLNNMPSFEVTEDMINNRHLIACDYYNRSLGANNTVFKKDGEYVCLTPYFDKGFNLGIDNSCYTKQIVIEGFANPYELVKTVHDLTNLGYTAPENYIKIKAGSVVMNKPELKQEQDKAILRKAVSIRLQEEQEAAKAEYMSVDNIKAFIDSERAKELEAQEAKELAEIASLTKAYTNTQADMVLDILSGIEEISFNDLKEQCPDINQAELRNILTNEGFEKYTPTVDGKRVTVWKKKQ